MGRHDDASVNIDVDIDENERRRSKKKSTKDRRRTREPSTNDNLSELSSRDDHTRKDTRRGRDRESRSAQDGSETSEVESETQEKKGSSGALIPRLIRAVICLLLLLAILFLFFIALSTPVIKPFYFFSLHEADSDGKYRFGIWGYCWPAVTANFDGSSAQTYDSGCGGGMLGWTLADVPGLADETGSVKHALTGALLINVLVILVLFIALAASVAGAALPDILVRKIDSRSKTSSDRDGNDSDTVSAEISVVETRKDKKDRKRKAESASESAVDSVVESEPSNPPSLDQISSGRRRMSALVAVAVVFAFFFMLVVFFFDLGALLQIRRNVSNASAGTFSFGWGPAFWFVLVAFLLVLLALILAFIDMVLTIAQNPKSTDKKSQADDEEEDSRSRSVSRSKSRETDVEKQTRRAPKTARSDSGYSEGQMVDVDLRSDVGSRRPRGSKSDKSRRKRR